MMKTRLAANIDGYPLRLVLLLEKAYCNGPDLILGYSNTNNEEFGPGFSVFSVFQLKRRFEGIDSKNCQCSVAHKT